MEIIQRRNHILARRESLRTSVRQIGFVPTMGALHEGHLSLIRRSLSENDVTFVSIYVNPKQFNDAQDLKNYPRNLDVDIAQLRSLDSQKIVLFCPETDDIYPENDLYAPINLGALDLCLEGALRPGHFHGVAHVVHNFFQLIQPDRAYFGQKDFQQLAVIQHLVHTLSMPVKIIACPTKRSEKGLALSSRNSLLSDQDKNDALMLYQSLLEVKNSMHLPPSAAKIAARRLFDRSPLQLEYLEIVESITFDFLEDHWGVDPVCCVAAYCGKVRLIDNLLLSKSNFSTTE